MNVSTNDFFTICRLLSDARDWLASGNSDAADSYIQDAERILNNQKSSAPTELMYQPTDSIPDLSW